MKKGKDLISNQEVGHETGHVHKLVMAGAAQRSRQLQPLCKRTESMIQVQQQ
jgi:hypothetical protein